MQHLSDQQILEKYRQTDDLNLIGVLYSRYSHLVLSVSYKYLRDKDECEDACMEIFEKLISDLKKHQVNNFCSWLFTTTRNHALMKLRKENQKLKAEDEILNIFVENEDEKHLEEKRLLEIDEQKVKAAIGTLEVDQRLCVDLFYLQERSYQDIMAQTGFTFNQVKSYIQNGKRNLKNILLKQKNGTEGRYI